MIVSGRALALATGATVLLAGLAGGYLWLRGAGGCEPLTIAASEDKSDLLQALAAGYRPSGHCVQVTVEPVNPIDAQRYFASPSSWPGPPLDVWSPGSSAWLNLLGGPGGAPSLFFSPTVIAVPQARARPLGWADLAGLRIGHANPSVSTSGLNALIAEHAIGGDRLVAGVQRGVDHYAAVLRPDYLDATVTDEQAVRASGLPLAAVLPREGTVLADHPYAVLGSSRHQAAARDFYGFLTQPAQQARIAAAGYRPLGSGVDATVIPPPDKVALQALITSWRAVRKPTRLLVLLDASAPGTPGIARQLAHAMTGLQARDQVGVWAFPAPGQVLDFRPAGTDQIRALQSLGRAQGATRLSDAVESALGLVAAAYDPAAIDAVLLVEPDPPVAADPDLESALRGQHANRFVELFTIGPPSSALAAAALAGRGADFRPGDSAQLVAQVISNF